MKGRRMWARTRGKMPYLYHALVFRVLRGDASGSNEDAGDGN